VIEIPVCADREDESAVEVDRKNLRKATIQDERRARARLVARGRGQPRGNLDSRIQSVARSKHRLWNGAVPIRRLYDRFDEVHCIWDGLGGHGPVTYPGQPVTPKSTRSV